MTESEEKFGIRGNASERSKSFRTFEKKSRVDDRTFEYKAQSTEQQSDISGSSEVSQPSRTTSAGFPFKPDTRFSRKGHYLTYTGLFIFTFILFFRPYDLHPALAGLNSLAYYAAIITLVLFVPSQILLEGRFSVWTVEIKCLLFIAAWALITVPIARDPQLAWNVLSQGYIRVVLIFIVLVNVLRTAKRMQWLAWLLVGAGLLLSYQALDLYLQGTFNTEGYRVSVDYGMFGNANDMALFLLICIPITVAYGIASTSILLRIVSVSCTAILVTGVLVTQSRGAFLGLVAASAILIWKFGRGRRVKALIISTVIALAVIAVAPGNYGSRMLSIFDSSLDQVGSSNQRQESLERSILVTLRNPLGIGIGNSPIVGVRNLETHNAYTQVSSELGWLALLAYLGFLVFPLRKLSKVEKHSEEKELQWMRCLSIGFQASIVGYMVTSFFASVAYLWYAYYPIAFAVCLSRLFLARYPGDKDAKQT